MSFEPQEVFSIRNLVMSSKKETTYGTALLDASLTQRVRFEPGDFFALQKEYYADGDKSGKGHNWPTIHQVIAQMTSGQLNFDLDDWKAAWLGAFFFGNVATSGVGPFTHLFTYLTASNIFPVTGLYFEDTADIKTKWNDLAIASMKISGGPSGPLRGSASLVGSGRFTDGAHGALPAIQAAPIYLLGSDSDILIGPQAGAVSIKERIASWEVSLEQEIVPHRAPGGGMFSTFHKVGKQRASLQLVIRAKDADDVRTLFTGDTLREVQINTNSGAAAQLNIKFPGLYLTAAQLGIDGSEEIWTVSSDAEKGVIKSGAANYVEYTVISGQATWLTVG